MDELTFAELNKGLGVFHKAFVQERTETARAILLQDYAEKGVARIPGVFTPDEVNRMRGAAYSALYDASKTKQNYLQRRGDFPALLFWPSVTSDYLNEVRTDPRLAAIVRAFLGPDVRQLNNQLYYRFPGDGDAFAWHRDIRFRPEIKDPAAYLQTIIAIDRITEHNSPVEFIEGSHLTYPQDASVGAGDLRTFSRGGLTGTKYTAEPGDVMVWDLRILHGSEPNRSDQSRLTYMNGFCRADALDGGWPLYMQGGAVITERPRFK